MSNEKDCKLKEVTALVGEQWYKMKVIDCGFVDVETGDPYPHQPVALEFTHPIANKDKAWYETTQSPAFEPYNSHPYRCEDWNLESGGNSDLGEPLVAPFDGLVINAESYGSGWGNIIRILGRTLEGEVVCWMGAHLDTMLVKVGDIVALGQPIGTIGTANGRYAAHLHEQVSVGAVPGAHIFASDTRYDFRRPSEFYKAHSVDAELIDRLRKYDGK